MEGKAIAGKDILLVVEAVANEKGVDEDTTFDALEVALATAAKRRYPDEEPELRVAIDRATGDYKTYRFWDVLPDDTEELEFPDAQLRVKDAKAKDPALEVGGRHEIEVESAEFGRIAAQAAKQVIVQKLRDAERAQVIELFSPRVGELVNGSVKKVNREAVIVDLGSNAEAIVPREDWIPREVFRVGDRLRGLLESIDPEARGPQLKLTRTSKKILEELFRIEVPEISDGVIEILSCARDPGSRAKIAVKTNDKRIDPVGACVGMRGSRVQAVSTELGNERIDIVPWDDDEAQFALNAMAPAEVVSIVLDEETKTMDIAVAEENLAQAIGRGGQNVKLASELTGWEINIMTEEEFAAKREEEAGGIIEKFMSQLDVDEDLASVLAEEGFANLEEIAYVPIEELLAIPGLEEEVVEEIRSRAEKALEELGPAGDTDAPQPSDDLLTMDGMDATLAQQLAGQGILTMEDLAEQAIDDLLDLEGMTSERAGELIMTARAPWFAAEGQGAAAEEASEAAAEEAAEARKVAG